MPRTASIFLTLLVALAAGIFSPSAGAAHVHIYEKAGSRATRVASGAPDTYNYDSDNRLVSISKNTMGGNGLYYYGYDSRTRRVLRAEPGTTGDARLSFSGGTSVQEYAPSGGALVAETMRGDDDE